MIFDTFKKTVIRHRLIDPGDKILLAFSGGQDSSILLALMLELRREMPLAIGLAHFNHKLRPSSDEDAEFARSIAAKRRLPFFTESRNVRLYARRRRLNLEEAARELRYDFLRRAGRRWGATKIATGHTLTDQAETMLMRLLRGTGLQGLTGIAPIQDKTIIRPLLDLERGEIEAHIRKLRIPYRTDETNFNRHFLRNRIRLDLIPELERLEPSAVRRFGRLAEILKDDESLLEMVTKTAWQELSGNADGRLTLNVGAFSLLPRALARRLVRKFLWELQGDLRGISFEGVESIIGLQKGKEKTVSNNLVVRREGDRLFLKAPRLATKRFEVGWDGQKTLVLRIGKFAFKASILKMKDMKRPHFNDSQRAFLDGDDLKLPLLARNRRPGDKYRPLGAPGSKKLKELLRAKNIPSAVRDALPVFVSGGRIVWIPGLPVSEDFKIKKQTKKIVLIEMIGESASSPPGHKPITGRDAGTLRGQRR